MVILSDKDIPILLHNCNERVAAVFGFGLKDIPLEIAPTRADYERIRGIKTAPWQVASVHNNRIILVSLAVWVAEDVHRAEELPQILTHELTHLYVQSITSYEKIPAWLNEGLALHIADQCSNWKKNGVPSGFTKIIDSYQKFYELKSWSYPTSCLFVEYLSRVYGIDKIIRLLNRLNHDVYNYDYFCEQFLDIYNVPLEQVEKQFLDQRSTPDH